MYKLIRNKFQEFGAKTAAVLSISLALSLAMPMTVFAAADLLWGNGVLVAEKVGSPNGSLQMIPDGKGNVFVTWTRNDTTTMTMNSTQEVYVQKLGPDGSRLWASPVMVSKALNYNSWPNQIAVSDDGIIVIWSDNRNKRKPDIFAQKISAGGKKLWGENGMTVYDGAGAQEIHNVISDGSNGVVVIWKDDERPGLYMQRIDSSGNIKWKEGGISINDITGMEADGTWPNMGMQPDEWVNVVFDGRGGFYLNWNDLKNIITNLPQPNPFPAQDGNIFLQRVDGDGKKVWPSNFSVSLKNTTQNPFSISQISVLEDASVVLQWSLPVGSPSIEFQTSPNSSSGYSNPNVDYYFDRIMPDGTSAWDYSKPFFQMRGDTKSKTPTQFESVSVMPVKGGLIFFEEISKEENQVNKSSNSETQTVNINASNPMSQTLTISKVDLDMKTVWKKQIKSNSIYIGPVMSYSLYGGSSSMAPGADSFFLGSSAFSANEMGQSKTTVSKFSSETGNELWQPGGITMPNAKDIIGPFFGLDGKGGLYAAWSVGSDLKSSPSTPAIGSNATTGVMPEYQQSNIYAQHIIDDGSVWSDLPISDWAYGHVQNLVKSSAVSGYGNGEYRPDSPVTRAEFTKMVVLALDVNAGGSQNRVKAKNSDIINHWSKQYMETALAAGAIKGYADGTLKPDAKITRAEAASMICRVKGLKKDVTYQNFTDVPKNHWAFGDIEAIYGLGTVNGYGDGTFRPSSPLTRAESAKIIDSVANGLK